MDLKTGTAKNTSFWGMMKQVIKSLTALCCNMQATIKPSEVLYLSGILPHTEIGGYAIQAITDCTFTVLTIDNLAPGSDADIATKTLTAGHIWYLDIEAVTLAGGECLIYKV